MEGNYGGSNASERVIEAYEQHRGWRLGKRDRETEFTAQALVQT